MTGSPDEERSPAERLRDRPALKSIRSWVAEETDPERLTEWIEAIAQDSRRGARRLAETWDRRRQAVWAERKRLARLFEHRDTLNTQGYRMIAGVDEVGVGPLAGPVVAGAVVLPDAVDLPGLNDSKKLSATARERLAREIRECAVGVAVAEVPSAEIDRLNILQATLEAMRRAVMDLCGQLPVDHLTVDARTIPGLRIPQTPLVHGDAIDGSIAAASIVAKVHRDALMQDFDEQYPGYGLGRHMGYGTAQHIEALQNLGPSPIHRRSFAPVAAAIR